MSRFNKPLLSWYGKKGRKNLPWQLDSNSYKIWVSEIMLQQTQVATVIPYYNQFMAKFPDVEALASAKLDDVLALWSGLGYYARARNLHKTAQLIQGIHQGVFPKELTTVMTLPGIGRSTAAAILAFSYNQREVILDGNVKRVLSRYHAIEGFISDKKVEKQLWELAKYHTPKENVAHYTQAIMDLGALICKRRNPDCGQCPLKNHCQALQLENQHAYPKTKPKKILPVKNVNMHLIRDNEQNILLEKRPPAGIWGGLWSFPESSCDIDQLWSIESKIGGKLEKKSTLPVVRHTFSHFRLCIYPHVYQLQKQISLAQDNLNWVDMKNIEDYGMPKPVKSLIKSLEQQS